MKKWRIALFLLDSFLLAHLAHQANDRYARRIFVLFSPHGARAETSDRRDQTIRAKMSLSHRLPHRILSSCSTPRFLVFSNTPSFFSTHYVVPPRPPPALSLIASSSVTVEPQVQNFLSDVENPDFPSPTPDLEEIPVRLPLEKLFLPPEVEVDGDLAKARVLKGSNIVLGPYAKGELIFKADFVKSSTKTEDCPSEGLPEFALVGRSNVGKSSLLNSIVRRKRLALTSKKPG